MTKGSLYSSLYRSRSNGEANSQIYKIAKVLCAYLTHTEPSSNTNTSAQLEAQKHGIYVATDYLSHIPIQNTLTKTRPTRLNSPAHMTKTTKTPKITRPLPPRSLTYFIKHSGTNPMAHRLRRHPY